MAKNKLPVGAVPLKSTEPETLPFERRTGAEQYQKLAEKVYAYWPSNRNSKAVPNEGPFTAKCRETGREFAYFTHRRPDRQGIFIAASLDLHPEICAERVDERAAKDAALPESLRDMIEAHRMSLRTGR